MVAHHLPTIMECYSRRQVGVAGSTPVDGTLLPEFKEWMFSCFFLGLYFKLLELINILY
jgi:hypothetical protein